MTRNNCIIHGCKSWLDYQTGLSTPPIGYVSVYSTANDAENFAENFAYYVESNSVSVNILLCAFKMLNDPQLIEEYDSSVINCLMV